MGVDWADIRMNLCQTTPYSAIEFNILSEFTFFSKIVKNINGTRVKNKKPNRYILHNWPVLVYLFKV